MGRLHILKRQGPFVDLGQERANEGRHGRILQTAKEIQKGLRRGFARSLRRFASGAIGIFGKFIQ